MGMAETRQAEVLPAYNPLCILELETLVAGIGADFAFPMWNIASPGKPDSLPKSRSAVRFGDRDELRTTPECKCRQ